MDELQRLQLVVQNTQPLDELGTLRTNALLPTWITNERLRSYIQSCQHMEEGMVLIEEHLYFHLYDPDLVWSEYTLH
jgi:hypothetical protein